jgi:hypothetical protein
LQNWKARKQKAQGRRQQKHGCSYCLLLTAYCLLSFSIRIPQSKVSNHKLKSTNGEFLSVGTQKLFLGPRAEERDQLRARGLCQSSTRKEAITSRQKGKRQKEKVKKGMLLFPFSFCLLPSHSVVIFFQVKSQSCAHPTTRPYPYFALRDIVFNGTKVAIANNRTSKRASEEAHGGLKMRVRLLIILLLMSAMAMIVSAQQPPIKDDSPAGQVESKLTAEEEREAMELAARFSERLRATSDFGPMVDELFVQNFSELLKRAPQDSMPLGFLDKSLIVDASPDDLRHYYVASMNFYELYFRLLEVACQLKKQAGSEDDPKFEEIVSPEVIDVLLKNPLAAAWIKEELSDEKESNDNSQPAPSADSAQAVQTTTQTDNDKAKEETTEGMIRTLSQLNDTSATFEKANEMLRERLKFMPIMVSTISGDVQEESEDNSGKPDLASLDEGEFGLPHGTQVIHMNVSFYSLYLIKTDGRLKILSINIYMD